MHVIKKITWEEILPVWRDHLWIERKSVIESTSAMCLFLGRRTQEHYPHQWESFPAYDLKNMEYLPTFWGVFKDDTLIGVNSGHMCMDKLYRSRGLYVFPEYRGCGLGTKLLTKTIAQGVHEGAIATWSYPKRDSHHTYVNTGFYPIGHSWDSGWEDGETGMNMRVVFVFNRTELNLLEEKLSKQWSNPD